MSALVAALDAADRAAQAEATTRAAHVLVSARALLAARAVLAARSAGTGPHLDQALDELAGLLAEEEAAALAHQRAVLGVLEANRARAEAERAARVEALERHHERRERELDRAAGARRRADLLGGAG